LATQLEIKELKCKFLLRLTQLRLKRKQWQSGEKSLEELTELVNSNNGSGESGDSIQEQTSFAQFKMINGDLMREYSKQFSSAKDFYLEAEEQISKLTEDSFVQALDEAIISSYVVDSLIYLFLELMVWYFSAGMSGKSKLAKGMVSASGPRLSMEPPQDVEMTPLGCLPLRRIHIRTRVKRSVAMMLEAKATKSVELLEEAKSELDKCNAELRELIDTSEEGVNANRLVGSEQALVLYQSARCLVIKFELEAKNVEESYELLWKQSSVEVPTNGT